MTDLVIRPLQPGESALFLSLPDPGLVGVASIGRDYDEYAAKREYRPEWTWVAFRDGEVVARAAWWAGPEDTEPRTLDWFDFRDADAGVALLRAAALPGEFCLILDVLRRVHSVTLDAHALRTTASEGLDAAAREDLEFLRWMPSPRKWWRLAYTPSGELVGITAQGRNYAAPVISIIGVAPEQRGHSYGYDLLVEATHLLAAECVAQIVAETDATNTPMARSFARAGYPITQERVFLV